MIRTKAAADLDNWIEKARASLIAPLTAGVAKDATAITGLSSNGQTDGQITQLKLVKRQRRAVPTSTCSKPGSLALHDPHSASKTTSQPFL